MKLKVQTVGCFTYYVGINLTTIFVLFHYFIFSYFNISLYIILYIAENKIKGSPEENILE